MRPQWANLQVAQFFGFRIKMNHNSVRKDNRVTRSDNEIIDFMADAMLEEAGDPQQYLDRLALRE